MSSQQPSPVDRPVRNGLVALLGVGLGVGLILGIVALVGANVLGLGDSDAASDGGATARESLYLPSKFEETRASGPLVTLFTQDTDEPTDVESTATDEATETASSEATASESVKDDEISLQAEQTSVASGDRIYISGVYPAGEGAILWVQRWENGGWTDFPASLGVTNGTFRSYVFTGVSGPNRFRVIDRDTGRTSNEIRVQVG